MKYILIAFFLLFGMNVANASFTQCADNFYQGQPPVVTNPKLLNNTYQLCYTGFAVLYSGVTKTPIYSAERLTEEKINAGKAFKRDNAFHADKSIPTAFSASLNDYRNSGYDKGHATPFADLATADSQHDSFTLTNIMPQAPKNNQQAWRLLEESVRESTKGGNSAYVITGAIYNSNLIKKVGTVLVPDYIYKIVYSDTNNAVNCYLVQNTNEGVVHKVGLPDLENMTGIHFFSNK